MKTLKDKVVLITGASRGIGKAIALRAAQDGAKIAILAKTVKPHPKLEGTIYTAAEEIQQAGGGALPLEVDVRLEEQVQRAIDEVVKKWNGIDILVNNASAIQLSDTSRTEMKKFDLMFAVNVRATFMCSKLCVPYLKKSSNPHILNISPPLNLKSKWFAPHVAYTMSKMGMSLCVLGMAEEFKADGIAVNALWPRTTIATAAIFNLLGGEEVAKQSRKPSIVADAAHIILTKSSREFTGNFCIDEDVLNASGVSDLGGYAVTPGASLIPDFFLD